MSTINARIAAFGKKTTTWKEELQTLAVDCVELTFAERVNVDPLSRLVHALGKGADMQTLIHWIEAHGLAAWNKKAEYKITRKGGAVDIYEGAFVVRKGNKVFDKEALLAVKWYAFAKEAKKVESSFDTLACIEKVKAYLTKIQKEALSATKETDIDADEKLAATRLANIMEELGRNFGGAIAENYEVKEA